ncbi:MAG: class II glutamine amidotransferase [Gammaproteobacteria bacterium]|nr:MAG: class II glutamine amidotransferase [Gammaproteobacteria bacterium]
MCRWITYKGKPIFLEDWIFNSEHSLIEQSKAASKSILEVNGDGFGVGWYGTRTEPGLFRSIRPAWNNVNLQSLAGHVISPLFLAHVRAATGTPIQETNSHPFQYKNWQMVHNGLIHNYGVLKKELLNLIDEQYFNYILGSTDSEILFYILLTNGMQQDIHGAVTKTVQQLEEMAANHGYKYALRMTLGISDGNSVWAVRYSSNQSSPSLFYSLEEQEGEQEQLLVVSEPLEHDTLRWIPVGERTILRFDEDYRLSVCSF